MAGSGKGFGIAALAVVTVAAGWAIGDYMGATHSAPAAAPAVGVQENGVPPDVSARPQPKIPHLKPARLSSDYTAPGAPSIHIVEAKTPTLGSPSRDTPAPHHALHSSSDTTDTADIPTPDAEASQEAAKEASTSDSSSSDSSAPPAPDSASVGNGAEASQAGSGTPPTPAPASPTVDAAPLKSTAPPPPGADSEASQASGGRDGAAHYRIQAGAFSDAKSAHDYISTLQSRGVDASVHAERQGAQTVYHVQVGAYHDRAAAEDAAASYRHSGVPVTVTPIGP